MSYLKGRAAAIQSAKAVLVRFGVSTPPVPVETIAQKLGIKIQYIPLDDQMSGMAFVKGISSVIVVNSVHHLNRQRFTLAHELAHHVLHKSYLSENVHVDTAVLQRNARSSTGTDFKEVQANTFAAELLMPQMFLRGIGNIDVNDELLIQRLANQFKVSVTAMAIRLENLQTDTNEH